MDAHREWFGLLNVNKPKGVTSRVAVDKVARLVRPAKAGHAGTLDPLASGVLVLCLGPATRLIDYVQRMPKRYIATFLLGRRSPTDDLEGDVTLLDNAPQPTCEQIEAALDTFTGEIRQTPPQYSAIKVDGKRAYKLARAGKIAPLAPRPVTVYRLSITHYEYPELVLDIECGAGVYVRSIGRDLAAELGTAAVMSDLVRSAVGSFTLDNAIALDELTKETIAEHIQSPLAAVATLPQVVLSPDEQVEIANGRYIQCDIGTSADEAAAVNEAGELLAILRPRGRGAWGARLNFFR